MRILKVLVCALLLVALSACVPSTPEDTTVEAVGERIGVSVGGLERSFLLRVPEHKRDEQLPVVVALHGVGGSSQDFEDWTKFSDGVDTDRYIAVYPDGSPLKDERLVWNAGGCCSSAGSRPADDVEFLTGILDELESYGADPDRIYVAGFSNGGMMTYRLACDIGDRIAGIAVVAGAFNVTECSATNPIPVVIIHGTADDTVPYDGGVTATSEALEIRGVPNASVSDAVGVWVNRNGCEYPGTITTSTSVRHESINGCSDAGASVDVYTIEGGTHTWTTNDGDLNMTDVILDHFVR